MNSRPADSKLGGRVAIVTGATSGIGRATAIELARRGAKVLGVARDAEQLAALKAEADIETVALSLSARGADERTVDAARAMGPVTILVHAAGRGGYLDRPIFEQSVEGWRETLAINLDSAFGLTRLVARDIRDEQWGRIVMISSTAGEIGAPAMAPYCASKHGLIGLMRSVAQDLAPHGGTCNAVLPSWVRTKMAERDAAQVAEHRKATVDAIWAERAAVNPRGRLVTLEEVTATVAFLAGPESSGINGQAITVSAGSIW